MRWLAGAVAWWLCATTVAASEPARLSGWLAGEWNNNEQVWQQKIDAADPKIAAKEVPVAHLHTRVVPVDVPALGPGVLWVQTLRGDDLQQAVQPPLLWQVSAVGEALRVRAWRLVADERFADAHRKPDLLRTLTEADLLPQAGCDWLLRFDAAAQAYTGGTESGRCLDRSLRPGQALARDVTVRVAETGLSVLDQVRGSDGALLQGNAPAQRSRKARYFEGWVWFRNAGPGAASDDKDTSFTANYRLHSEGQRLVLLRKDGSESPWMLELAALTYQNTRRAILKFALIERATGKTLSYTWANPEASALGMNLGWFQAGVTQRAGDLQRFGF